MNRGEDMGNSIEYSLNRVLLKLFCFLLLPLYTRFLGPPDMGIAEMIISFSNIANYLITFCLFSGLMRFVHEYQSNKQKVRRLYGSILMFTILNGVVLVVVLSIFSNTIGKIIFGEIEYYPTVLIGLIGYILGCVNLVYEYILKGMENSKKIYISNIFYLVVLIFFNITFVMILKMGVNGVLMASLIVNIGLFVYMLIDLLKNKMIIVCLDKSILKEVLKSTAILAIPNIFFTVTSYVSKRFIYISYGLVTVGVFAVAARLGTIIEIMLIMLNISFGKYLYTKLDNKEKNRKEDINRYATLLVYVYGALLIAIALFSHELIMVFLDKSFVRAWTVMAYIAIIGVIKIIYYFYVNILLYYKTSVKKISIGIFFSSCLNILCSYYLIPKYEMYGLVLSELIGLVICLFIIIRLASKKEELPFELDTLAPKAIMIVGFIIIGLVPSYVKFTTEFSSINLGYKVTVMLIYMCLCAHFLKSEVKNMFRKIRNKKIYNRMKKIYLNKGVREKIVFICNNGYNYGGSPKAIANLVHNECKRYEIVWLFKNVDKKKKIVPSYVKCVKIGSKQAYREMATAKVWVSDSILGAGIYKGRKQKYIYTGEGDRYFNKIYLDRESNMQLSESQMCDLMVSGSDFGRKICKSAYGYNGEIYNFGCPRNDILVNTTQNYIEEIKKKLNTNNKKILLYVLSAQNLEQENLDIKKVLKTLEDRDKCKWIAYVCIKGDKYSKELVGKLKNNSENIIDMTKYEDMSDLLLVADSFVTDYSFYAGDFILTKKAVALYQPQCYEDIIGENEKYFDIKESPYMVGKNTEEVCEILKYLEDEIARKNSFSIMRFYGTIETGFASKKIVEYINKLSFEDSESIYNN